MKRTLQNVVQILGIRFSVIVLSFGQTTLWAAKMGGTGFGIASTYLAAQVFASLFSRLGADNVIVRSYQKDPDFASKFAPFLAGIFVLSTLTSGAVLAILCIAVFHKVPAGKDAWGFAALVLAFNLSSVFSVLALAQKRATLATLVGKALPVAISIPLFLLFQKNSLDGTATPFSGLSSLAIGHFASAAVLLVMMRGFFVEAWRTRARRPWVPFLGSQQWYFLGYQTMSSIRVSGTTIAIAAIFGPLQAGVFALANRFGSVLTYLNEPARLHVTPRVIGKTKGQIARLYRNAVLQNAGLIVLGLVGFVAIFRFASLPFSTDPPFYLYTSIIFCAAVVLVLVGPAGPILAMSGYERFNFVSNFIGLLTAVILIGLSALLASPLLAVIGAAASSAATNLVNLFLLLHFFRRRETEDPAYVDATAKPQPRKT